MSRPTDPPTSSGTDEPDGVPSLRIVAGLFAVLLVVVLATVVVLGHESGNRSGAPGTTVTLPAPGTPDPPVAPAAPAGG